MWRLQTSAKTLEARCDELKDAAAGHEQRAKNAGAELLQSHHIVDKLTVREVPGPACLLSQISRHRPVN